MVAIHHLPLPQWWRKLNLLLASYAFYAAWNPPFVALLWLSTIVDFVAARKIDRSKGLFARRVWLAVSLSVNLGVLGFFKYGGFLLENFAAALNALGVAYQPAAPNIILPVGISFYTFQTLSYTIDVYRRRERASATLLDFALYVTFFPQLVAGPIVRATDFLPQLVRLPRATAAQLSWGACLLSLGLFEKVVLADAFLAPAVERVYDVAGTPDTLAAWTGTLAFTGQIFCDFAGYSTCAIGAALCLGLALPDNFRFPYAAVGFSDFWRRWHISLSTWLRDYLYIPLGGNRSGKLGTNGNLMAVMLIGGLWHGAAWTFVAWGGLHGLYLVGERLIRRRWGDARWAATWFGRFGLGVLTFLLVCVTWVFFRSPSFGHAFEILGAMIGLSNASIDFPPLRFSDHAYMAITLCGLLTAHMLLRHTTLEEAAARFPWWIRPPIAAGLLMMVVINPSPSSAFIYFQF